MNVKYEKSYDMLLTVDTLIAYLPHRANTEWTFLNEKFPRYFSPLKNSVLTLLATFPKNTKVHFQKIVRSILVL